MLHADDDPRIGTVLQGRYRITELLSHGGMGVVYRGERIALGRSVAIKFLHAAYSSQANFVKRFGREATLTSRLEHPNVVSVIDFGVDEGAPYIVMDYVAGQTLRDLLEDGPVEPRRATDITSQILAGLAHAHERDIIHRDVKPPNVMLTKATASGDHVQLLDFGLAKIRDVDQTSSSVVVGTPSYMSPEQAAGSKADERTDIYSTGLILFELLTGTKVFEADEPLALLRMHIEQEPDSLGARRPDGAFTAELEAVVRRSLAKSREERFQTAAEMLEALADSQEASGRSAPVVPPPKTSDGAPPMRRSFRGLAWFVVPVAAVALWWSIGKPGPADIARRLGIDVRSDEDRGSDVEPTSKPETGRKSDGKSNEGAVAAAENEDREVRIRHLHALLRETPKSPSVLYELGKLYFDKDWGSEGLAAYRGALSANERLRRDARLNRDAISALDEPKTRDQARALIVKSIGKPAIPFLRSAARARPRLRSEVAELIRMLEP